MSNKTTDKFTVWLWQHKSTAILWSIVTLCSLVLAVYLIKALAFDPDKTLYLSGNTSNGHYQFETQCELCHKPFQDDMQDSCVECHGKELKRVEDSHRAKKFKDPREAQYLEKISALECVTCHREHQPERTHNMGVTQPKDFCISCHEDIAEDRSSHKDLAFDGCTQCHNYHDNRALYEDFLAKHLDESNTHQQGNLPKRDLLLAYREFSKHPIAELQADQHDGPADTSPTIIEQWQSTQHAQSGVNCSHCHAQEEWQDQLDNSACKTCHDTETSSFIEGRHGMRSGQKLSAMNTSNARLPMDDDANEKSLNCISCHGAHDFDTKKASIDGCLGCHADDHSKNYKQSAHYKRLLNPQSDAIGQHGVSCSGCHFPRDTERLAGQSIIRVNHNQNDNLRPNSKQIRSVCMHCHGLGFSLDALADPDLIRNNFNTPPNIHLDSLKMVAEREKRPKKSDRKTKKPTLNP